MSPLQCLTERPDTVVDAASIEMKSLEDLIRGGRTETNQLMLLYQRLGAKGRSDFQRRWQDSNRLVKPTNFRA